LALLGGAVGAELPLACTTLRAEPAAAPATTAAASHLQRISGNS